MAKKCGACGICKEEHEFNKNRGKPDGLMSHCRRCHNEARAEYRRNNRHLLREVDRRSREKNKEKRRRGSVAYYRKNAEAIKERERRRRQQLKDEAYAAYGGYRCACCGETEPKFLCLDHVNNDGALHRKAVDPAKLYFWLKKNKYPPTFQVLCANCNQGKNLNGGVCPHQLMLACHHVTIQEV